MIEAAERLRQRAGNTRREPDYAQMTADTEELEEIFRRTFWRNRRDFRNTEIENHRVYGESNKTLRKSEYKPKSTDSGISVGGRLQCDLCLGRIK